jgi:hypothetical protein
VAVHLLPIASLYSLAGLNPINCISNVIEEIVHGYFPQSQKRMNRRRVCHGLCLCQLCCTSILIPSCSFAGIASSPVATFDTSLFLGGIVTGNRETMVIEGCEVAANCGLPSDVWQNESGEQRVPRRRDVKYNIKSISSFTRLRNQLIPFERSRSCLPLMTTLD